MRFIELVKPIMGLLPEVDSPMKKQNFSDKLMWTAWTLFIYLICCQIPLYGMIKTEGADPLYWLRVILASNKGTIMELGMSPIITSGMVMQLLTGAKMLDVNMNSSDDRKLFQSTQKLFGLLITFGEALAYLLSGMYGPVGELGFFRSAIIVLQLFLAGFMVLMLDELLQKGYGLGSGISLFIATNICETVMWKSFSPVTIRTDQGTEFEGAIIAAFHFLMTKPNPVYGLYQAFQRQNAPNLANLLATVLVCFIVVYFQDFKVKLQLTARKTKGHRQPFPVNLFYTSNIPIIL
jgi:protein transport protein SEC61 subunit alpha